MHKLDFLGVTDTEYQLLATFRSAILGTPRNEHLGTVSMNTRPHTTYAMGIVPMLSSKRQGMT